MEGVIMTKRITETIYDFDSKIEDVTTTYDNGSFIRCINKINDDGTITVKSIGFDTVNEVQFEYEGDDVMNDEKYMEYIGRVTEFFNKLEKPFIEE